LEPPLCVVSSWVIKRVYTILVWNTISGSSNLDICFLSLFNSHIDLHLKALCIITIVVVLLLFIIYTINLPVVRPRSCRVIYYFDTPALGRRHQSFGRVRQLPNIDVMCKPMRLGQVRIGLHVFLCWDAYRMT
jgi:hypothetical protein